MLDSFIDLPAPKSPLAAKGVAQPPFAASSETYLLTKVTVPPVPLDVVTRSLLLPLLERHLPLTLLTGGAGYGKTTLLASFAQQRQEPVAWLTLERLENDPLRFWTYVLLALRMGVPAFEETVAAWRGAMNLSLLPALLTELLNTLLAQGEALTLILDDYQVIEEPQIGQSLAFLLTHAPACLHVVLASRTDPALPLARLRAHGQVLEIREAQLQFTPDEARQFLTHTMGLALADTALQGITARAEGWVAGLQLAALALRARPDASAQVERISGSHAFLLEYVQQDILATVEPAIRTFLLHTCVLNELTAPLCQAVTGDEASEERLRALSRSHLFVAPLDTEQRWYRLHPLVREALLTHLLLHEPTLVPCLHQRAAGWYAEQQLFPEAIVHALEAADGALAAELIEHSVVPQSWHHPYHTLRGLLSRLPRAVLDARPQLCLLAAQAFFMTTPIDTRSMPLVETYLSRALHGYRAASNHTGIGSVLAFRAMLIAFAGHFADAFVLAREALALLPEDDVQWRGHALGVLGMAALMEGSLDLAQPLLQQALTCFEASRLLGGRQFAVLMQAEVHLMQGDRVRAGYAFLQVLRLASLHPEQASAQLTDTLGKRRAHFEYAACYSLAALAFEENRLEEAQRLLEAALSEGQFALVHVLTPGLLLQVRLLQARGQGEQARTLLLDLEATVQEADIRREIQLCQAWGAQIRGDRMALEAWAAGLAQHTGHPLSWARREEEVVLLARLRIAQEQPEEAVFLLEPLLEEARRSERQGSVLTILVVLSLAEQTRGKRARARQRLREAVSRASSQGGVRLFLEEGEDMEQLLRTLLPDLSDALERGYVETLLRAFAPANAAELDALMELTPQEQRVLDMLAQGASNQEIARALVIGVATVKKHVSHLLAKLGVRNRTQLLSQARKRGLL